MQCDIIDWLATLPCFCICYDNKNLIFNREKLRKKYVSYNFLITFISEMCRNVVYQLKSLELALPSHWVRKLLDGMNMHLKSIFDVTHFRKSMHNFHIGAYIDIPIKFLVSHVRNCSISCLIFMLF